MPWRLSNTSYPVVTEIGILESSDVDDVRGLECLMKTFVQKLQVIYTTWK